MAYDLYMCEKSSIFAGQIGPCALNSKEPMKEIVLQTQVSVCQENELNEQQRQLVEAAKRKTQDAYCPYSHFGVGAAALLADGQVITGCNQENAAYPSGLCAERSAIFGVQSHHPEQPIRALAIAARNDNGFLPSPISPCGACRQVILEMEDRYQSPVRILLYGTRGTAVFRSIQDLLPLSFVDANMRE